MHNALRLAGLLLLAPLRAAVDTSLARALDQRWNYSLANAVIPTTGEVLCHGRQRVRRQLRPGHMEEDDTAVARRELKGCGLPGLVYPRNQSRFDTIGPVVVPCPDITILGDPKTTSAPHVCTFPQAHGGAGGAENSPKHCVAVSASRGDVADWAWEVAFLEAFPACHLHVLECHGTRGPPPHALTRERATVHDACMGRYDAKSHKGLVHTTYEAFADAISLRHRPQLLRLDLGGREWEVLEGIAGSGGTSARLPVTISVRWQYRGRDEELESAVGWASTLRGPFEIGGLGEYLFTRGGYVIVDRRDPPGCTWCSDVVFARAATLEHHAGSAWTPPSAKNAGSDSGSDASLELRAPFAERFPGRRGALDAALSQRAAFSFPGLLAAAAAEGSKGAKGSATSGEPADVFYPQGHGRFDVLGPVTQCPPGLLHVFGQGDGEKRICSSHLSSGDEGQAVDEGQCVVLSIGSHNE